MKWQLTISLILAATFAMAQVPIYTGGGDDGFGRYTLSAPTAFNHYAGGSNSGFAWHNGYSPIAVNIFNGGANDGFTQNILPAPIAFNLYNGGNNDGFGTDQLTAPFAFNLYKGGANDGFAWSNGYSPLEINIFNGGINDGFSAHSLSPASAFNLYSGGSNDGFSNSGLAAPSAFSLYAGGANDGFAWSNGYSPLAINIFNGGINDGFANNILSAPLAFSLYKGGMNDGFATDRRTPSLAFNLYKGGYNDGFGMGSNKPCTPPTLQANSLTNITTTDAIFSWVSVNPGAGYSVQVREQGGSTIQFAGASVNNINTIPIYGLTPNTTYCISVFEICAETRTSVESATRCFTTANDNLCDNPTVLQNLSNNSSSVTVGWTPGIFNSNYEVMLVKGSTHDTFTTSGPITAVSGAQQRATLSCLPVGSFFTYYVRESCGPHSHSPWVNGFTTYTSTGCSAPTLIDDSIINTQNVKLSWESSYGTDTARPYQISYGIGITSPAQGTKTAITMITPSQVNGYRRSHVLSQSGGVGGISWFVREICRECDSTVWVGPHTVAAPYCLTPATVNLVLSAVTNTTATVSWVSTNYNTPSRVELCDAGNAVLQSVYLPASVSYSRSQAFTGLSAATIYHWRVREYCSATDSTAYTPYQSFTTNGAPPSSCAPPTAQGVMFTSGQYLMATWVSPLYLNSSKGFEIAGGMNITSPGQATIRTTSGYYRTQDPVYPTFPFTTGNQNGFAWYVRDICGPGDTSTWLGPWIVGSSMKNGDIESAATGIADADSTGILVQLYPNPNSGKELHVTISGAGKDATITIYDLQGKVVTQHALSDNAMNTINVSELANAVYTCHIRSDQLSRSIRLVIQR